MVQCVAGNIQKLFLIHNQVTETLKNETSSLLFYMFNFQNNIYECKRKRQFWVKRQITDSANIEQWLLARQKVGK